MNFGNCKIEKKSCSLGQKYWAFCQTYEQANLAKKLMRPLIVGRVLSFELKFCFNSSFINRMIFFSLKDEQKI